MTGYEQFNKDMNPFGTLGNTTNWGGGFAGARAFGGGGMTRRDLKNAREARAAESEAQLSRQEHERAMQKDKFSYKKSKQKADLQFQSETRDKVISAKADKQRADLKFKGETLDKVIGAKADKKVGMDVKMGKGGKLKISTQPRRTPRPPKPSGPTGP